MDKTNRIFFHDNPYPKGHRIKEFVWNARLETGEDEDKEKGLYFDFHLKTEDYYEEDGEDDPEDFEPESDWKAKIVWGNFHSCTMSSTKWHYGGIKVADENDRVNIQNLQGHTLLADTPPIDMEEDYEDRAFHIYLLGHDACADHRITFKQRNPDGTYNIEWTGKIALAYVGETDLDYSFSAYIESVKFDGIYFSDELPLEASLDMLSKYIEDYNDFRLETLSEKEYKLILKK